MTNEKIKRMLDACYLAKRIREMLPPLPEGVMPSYIQYLDVRYRLWKKTVSQVKVSDISDALNLPRPGVTRTVKEMEQKGYLQKARFSKMTDVLRIFPLQKKAKSFPGNTMKSYFSDLSAVSWMTFQKKMRTV